MKIYEVPSDRRYWVVRAEGGLYYDHFTKNGLMALGHLKSLGIELKDSDKFIPDVNYKIEGTSALTSFFGLGYSFGSIEILLALRSSSASFDESYMMSFFGREMMTSWANEYEWQTTDIGIGFTF